MARSATLRMPPPVKMARVETAEGGTSRHSTSVVTFGEALLRLTVPEHGRLQDADEVQIDVAGAELNVAIALAHLGVPTSWISAVPDSPIGRRVELEATGSGVNIESVARVPGGRLGVFYVEYGVDPRPISVWYDRQQSTFANMDSFNVAPIAGARFVVVSGITPALSKRSAIATRTIVDEAQARGAQVCIDVNYRERLWTAADARRSLSDLLRRSSIVVCSTRDARRVFRCTGTDDEVLVQLHGGWCPQADVVALTIGEAGALAFADGVLQRQPGYQTQMVDRFGAGDAFTAGLLWGLLQGDLALGLRAGTALAALKCSIRGDHARFTSKELEDTIDRTSSRITR